MITLAVALADKWNKKMTGAAYFLAIIADCIWLSELARALG